MSMKGAWETVPKTGTIIYKPKEQREWERVEEAMNTLEKYLNVAYYKRINKSRQNHFKAKIGRVTKLVGLFWEKIGAQSTLDSF